MLLYTCSSDLQQTALPSQFSPVCAKHTMAKWPQVSSLLALMRPLQGPNCASAGPYTNGWGPVQGPALLGPYSTRGPNNDETPAPVKLVPLCATGIFMRCLSNQDIFQET